jgi:hypothetical protein
VPGGKQDQPQTAAEASGLGLPHPAGDPTATRARTRPRSVSNKCPASPGKFAALAAASRSAIASSLRRSAADGTAHRLGGRHRSRELGVLRTSGRPPSFRHGDSARAAHRRRDERDRTAAGRRRPVRTPGPPRAGTFRDDRSARFRGRRRRASGPASPATRRAGAGQYPPPGRLWVPGRTGGPEPPDRWRRPVACSGSDQLCGTDAAVRRVRR